MTAFSSGLGGTSLTAAKLTIHTNEMALEDGVEWHRTQDPKLSASERDWSLQATGYGLREWATGARV